MKAKLALSFMVLFASSNAFATDADDLNEAKDHLHPTTTVVEKEVVVSDETKEIDYVLYPASLRDDIYYKATYRRVHGEVASSLIIDHGLGQEMKNLVAEFNSGHENSQGRIIELSIKKVDFTK